MKRTFDDHARDEEEVVVHGETRRSEGEHLSGPPGKRAPGGQQHAPKRLRTVSLLSLEPFAFFVRAPPVAYAQYYARLADHMEALINEDFAPGERPFVISSDSESWFFSSLDGESSVMDEAASSHDGHEWLDSDSKLSFREQWKQVEAAVNDPSLLQASWKKLTLIDKILGLYDAERWKSTQHQNDYMPFERELWWVKTARGWFTKNDSSSYKGYLRVAASALMLELWYRFVWAGHTYRIYRDMNHRRKEAVQQMDDDESQESNKMIEEDDTKDDYDNEEVLDSYSLRALMHVSEENEDEEEEEDGLPADYEIALEASPRRGKHQSRSSSTMERDRTEGEDGESDSMDEAEEVLSSDEQSNQHAEGIPSVVNVFFSHPAIANALDAAESLYFDQLESFERNMGRSAPSAPTFTPFGPTNRDSQEARSHAAPIEDPFWQIGGVLEVFIDLVEKRNVEFKSVVRPSRTEIAADLCKLYKKRFVPFLQMMGIEMPGSAVHNEQSSSTSSQSLSSLPMFRWRWRSGMPPAFIEQVYVTCLRNITCDGTQSCGRHILDLLPEIFLLADSRLDAVLPQVATRIEGILRQKGKFNDEVNSLIALLDELLAEKKAIMQSQQQQLNVTRGGGTIKHALGQRVIQLRDRRLLEIEDTIQVVEAELHKLTGVVDDAPRAQIQASLQLVKSISREEEEETNIYRAPKLKKRPDKIVRTEELENELSMSLSAACKILNAACSDAGVFVVTLSPSDGALLFVASALFHASRVMGCYNAATKKSFQARMKGLGVLSQSRIKKRLEQILMRLLPAESKQRRRGRTAKTTGEMIDVASSIDFGSLAIQLGTELGLILSAPATDEVDQLPVLLSALHSSTTAKTRDAALVKIAKHVHQRAEPNLFASMMHTKTNVDLIMTELEQLAPTPSQPMLIVAVSASYLWDLRFAKDRHKRETFNRIVRLGEANPTRFKLVVYNGLDPREYLGDVHAFLPWRLEARGRTRDESLICCAEDKLESLSRVDQLFMGKIVRREAHIESFYQSNHKPNLVRDYYVFYPNSRAPIVPLHYGCHSLHLVPAYSQHATEPQDRAVPGPPADEPKAWQFYCKSDVDYLRRWPGTSLVALWERRPGSPERGMRQEWEHALRKWIQRKHFDARQIIEVLKDKLLTDQPAEPWASLIRSYEGMFVISDHPTTITVLSSPSYRGRISISRILSEADASSETTPSLLQAREANDELQQTAEQYSRLHVRTYKSDSNKAPFKYAIVGNEEFWQADRDMLKWLCMTIEERISSSPDDLVADAQAGPLTLAALRSQLRRDSAQANSSVRLISSVEEWADKVLRPQDEDKEVVFSVLMNISLEDPANWHYWRETLELPHAVDGRPLPHPNWSRITCKASVPPSYFPTDAEDALGGTDSSLVDSMTVTSVLDSLSHTLLLGQEDEPDTL